MSRLNDIPNRLDQNVATDVSNYDPYLGENDFDYTKWEDLENAMKLLSVGWESDYKNAVNWKTPEAREAFFNSEIPGEFILPETAWNMKEAMQWSPSQGVFVGEVIVQYPIESLREYNYLYLKSYELPVEAGGEFLTNFYYFISAMNSLSPSATKLYLLIDSWTTFFDKVEIKSLEVSRGHYAHKQVSASSFLSNPLNTSLPITEPEPDLPSVKRMVSYNNLISMSKSSPRVCIATSSMFEQPQQQWAPSRTGVPENGWYNDPGNGWNGSTVRPIAGTKDAYAQGAQNPTGIRVYSMEPQDFESFINFVEVRTPQLLESIQAVYVLPSEMIDEGPVQDIYGFSFRRVLPQPTATKIADLNITNALFDYDSASAQFAKLYTSQFAQIRISDMSGKSAMVSVEEIAGDLEVYARASTAFPFLKVQAFINGVGGNGRQTYAVAPFRSMTSETFESKWSDFIFDMDIPTYAVYSTGAELEVAKGNQNRYNKRQNIERSYTTALANNAVSELTANRSANVSHSNTTAAALVSRNNSYDSINAGLAAANAAALTSRNNSLLMNTTSHTNNTNVANQGYLNAVVSANSAQAISNASALTARTNTDNESAMVKINTEDANDVANLNTLDNINLSWRVSEINGKASDLIVNFNRFSANVENYLGISSSAIGLASSSVTSVVGAAGVGALAGGIPGAVAGAVAGVVSSVNSLVTGFSEIEVNSRIAQHQYDKVEVQAALSNHWEYQDEVTYQLIHEGSPLYTYTLPAGFSTNRTVADENKTKELALNTRNYNLTGNIAIRNKQVSDNASELTYDTAVSNAAAARGATLTTSSDSRDATIAASLATKNAGDTTTNATYSTTTDNAQNVATVNVDNASDTYDVTVSNSLSSRTAALANSSDSKANADAAALRVRTSELQNVENEIIAARSTPIRKYGSESGGGSSDAFGQRGLEISVERISKADEKLVETVFRKYGYRVPSIWVESPVLKQMSKFTYWECSDAWIYTGKVSDAIALTLKAMFLKGVWFWEDPMNVKLINLGENV